MLSTVCLTQNHSQKFILPKALLFITILIGLGTSGCTLLSDVVRQPFQAKYFKSVLWAPGLVTDIGEVCIDSSCFPVDSTNYIMVIAYYDSDTTCIGMIDEIVTLWALPDREGNADYIDRLPLRGTTVATARVPIRTRYDGVYLVNASGQLVDGLIDPDIRAGLYLFSMGLLYEGNQSETRNNYDYQHIELDPDCNEHMKLWPGVQIIGALDDDGLITPTIPESTELIPSVAPPTPTPLTEGTAFLSGVAFPAGTDGGSCGEMTVYAIDYPDWGQWFSTTVNDLPCRYTLEVPAPGTYILSAIQTGSNICGAHFTEEVQSQVTFGYCPGDCEPKAVSVQPGDSIDDLHIPLFLPPDLLPRDVPCPYIP